MNSWQTNFYNYKPAACSTPNTNKEFTHLIKLSEPTFALVNKQCRTAEAETSRLPGYGKLRN